MFKKLLLTLAVIAGVTFAASARDSYSRNVNDLPKGAQTTIANNFKAKVSVIKMDKDFGKVSEYEVVLTDGTEITFDRDGNWKDIEVGVKSNVPSAFVPKAVSDYVKKNQSGQKIVGIEKNRSGYDVELTNGIEMKFNKQGEFVKYD